MDLSTAMYHNVVGRHRSGALGEMRYIVIGMEMDWAHVVRLPLRHTVHKLGRLRLDQSIMRDWVRRPLGLGRVLVLGEVARGGVARFPLSVSNSMSLVRGRLTACSA